MLNGAIARRYAESVFNLAMRQNTLDRTLEDVRQIAQLFAIRKLSYLLREPNVPAKRKEAALRQALTDKVLPTSLNLALLVVQRGLVESMQGIAAELEQRVLDYRNQTIAEVTTAVPLDNAQQALVKKALEQHTGKNVIMHARIDPRIMGGIVARVGDQVIDGSVRSRLAALQQNLLNNVSTTQGDFAAEDFAQGIGDGHYGDVPAATQQPTSPSQAQV
jgi:F-type H+-transporting ATPase subunit delta